jgi:hypothetical protein
MLNYQRVNHPKPIAGLQHLFALLSQGQQKMEEAVETWPKYRKVLEHNGKDANI